MLIVDQRESRRSRAWSWAHRHPAQRGWTRGNASSGIPCLPCSALRCLSRWHSTLPIASHRRTRWLHTSPSTRTWLGRPSHPIPSRPSNQGARCPVVTSPGQGMLAGCRGICIRSWDDWVGEAGFTFPLAGLESRAFKAFSLAEGCRYVGSCSGAGPRRRRRSPVFALRSPRLACRSD